MAYGNRNYGNTPAPSLPRNYLEGGYFGADGYIKPELLVDVAQEVARALKGLNNTQFRRFYHHIRAVEQKLELLEDWRAVEGDIKKLIAFAAAAKTKNKIPPLFYDFIEKNVQQTNDEKSFRNGFLEHIQAVLAYHSSKKD